MEIGNYLVNLMSFFEKQMGSKIKNYAKQTKKNPLQTVKGYIWANVKNLQY